MKHFLTLLIVLMIPLKTLAHPPGPVQSQSAQGGIEKGSSLPGAPGGPRCLGLRDFDYEPVAGFDGGGYYFQGHVKTRGKEIVKQYSGRAEGCLYDENGNEKRFIGEWLSACQIESRDSKGRYFVLETDDCWCKRCFN